MLYVSFSSAVCPVKAAVWIPGIERGVLFYEETVWYLRGDPQVQGGFVIESRNGTGFPGLPLALVKAAFILTEQVVIIAGQLYTRFMLCSSKILKPLRSGENKENVLDIA